MAITRWNAYPYTDFHEMNLDWVLGEICKLHKDMDEFEVINQIKWKGTWNISKQYPIWSIVDNGEGFGYIAIKDVPAGIELTNEEYWRLTSNYSQLYADMQNRIIALEDRVNILDYTLKNYTLRDKQIAVYGDSWADPLGASSGWVNILSNYSGKQVHNNSLGGRTMSDIYNAMNDNFVADVYIIEGGVNDWNSNTNFLPFYNTCRDIIAKARMLNSDCDIIFTTPIARLSQQPNYPDVHSKYPLEIYRQIIWQCALDYNVMVCSGLSMNNVLVGDGLHPTPGSANNIAYSIIRAYLAGGDTRDFRNEIALTKPDSAERVCVDGGNVYIQLFASVNFVNGQGHIDNAYINSTNFFDLSINPCFFEVGGPVFMCYATLSPTGLDFKLIDLPTGRYGGSANLTVDMKMRVRALGLDDGTNRSNP